MSEQAGRALTEAERERETTRGMVARLAGLMDEEPPQHAGGHPSDRVHAEVGDRWAEWSREVQSWRTLIAPRLIREALDLRAEISGQAPR